MIDPITLKFHFTWLIMYDRTLGKKTQEIFDSICSDEDLCYTIIDRYLKVFNQISMSHPLNAIVFSKPSLKLLFLIIRYNSSMIKVISQYPSYFFIMKKTTYMLRNELMEHSYPFQESNNLYNIYKTSAIQYTFLLQKSSTYSEIVEFVQSSSSILSSPNQRLVLSMTIWLANTYNNNYLDEECIKKTNEILSKAFSYDELFHLYSLLVNIFWYNQSLFSSICTISKNKNFRALIFRYLISSLENPLDIAVLSYLYSLKLYSEIIKDIDFKHLLFPQNWLKFSRESTISLTIDINSVLDDISHGYRRWLYCCTVSVDRRGAGGVKVKIAGTRTRVSCASTTHVGHVFKSPVLYRIFPAINKHAARDIRKPCVLYCSCRCRAFYKFINKIWQIECGRAIPRTISCANYRKQFCVGSSAYSRTIT